MLLVILSVGSAFETWCNSNCALAVEPISIILGLILASGWAKAMKRRVCQHYQVEPLLLATLTTCQKRRTERSRLMARYERSLGE